MPVKVLVLTAYVMRAYIGIICLSSSNWPAPDMGRDSVPGNAASEFSPLSPLGDIVTLFLQSKTGYRDLLLALFF